MNMDGLKGSTAIGFSESDEDGTLNILESIDPEGEMFEYDESEIHYKRDDDESISSPTEAQQNSSGDGEGTAAEETYLEPEPELVDLGSEDEDQLLVRLEDSYQPEDTGSSRCHPADAADVQHDHAFAKTSKPVQPTRIFVHPQILKPKPPINALNLVPIRPAVSNMLPVNPPASNFLPIMPANSIVFKAADGKVYQLTTSDGLPVQLGQQGLPELLRTYVSVSDQTEEVVLEPTTELELGHTVTISNEVQEPLCQIEQDLSLNVLASAAFTQGSQSQGQGLAPKTKDFRRPAADSDIMKSSMLNIAVPGGTSLQMQRYIYTKALCRVCLIPKDNMVSLFEDVNVADNGLIENARGPHTANKFNLLPALKQMLDIDVSFGDALPSDICMECLDNVMAFSEFRKTISVAQNKLSEIIDQVKNSSSPTVIPQLGVTDLGFSNIYRHFELINNANQLLKASKYSHRVVRYLPNRVLDKIFSVISSVSGVGFKTEKLSCLEMYAVEPPFARGWFCSACRLTIQGNTLDFVKHFQEVHEIIEADDVPFGCDFCNEHFPLTDKTGLGQSYAQHWLHHFFFYECDLCHKKLPSAKSIMVHKRSAHTKSTKEYKCGRCKKSFSKKAHLVSHAKTHMSSEERRAFMNWCTICGKGLNSSLNVHMNTVHAEEVGTDQRWKCELCSKYFKRKCNLIGHRDAIHRDVETYKCDVCDETFKSNSAKILHMLKHNGLKLHLCPKPKCNKKFVSAKELQVHEATAHARSTKGFICEVCEKFFKRKEYLSEHMKTHSAPQHKCPYDNCNKFIRLKSNMYKHLKVHEKRDKKLETQAQQQTESQPLEEEVFEITLDLDVDSMER